MDFFAVLNNRSFDLLAVALAEYAHCKFGTTCTLKTADAEDFSLSCINTYMIDNLFLTVNRMIYIPVFNLEVDISDVLFSLGESVGNFTTNHSFDDSCF